MPQFSRFVDEKFEERRSITEHRYYSLASQNDVVLQGALSEELLGLEEDFTREVERANV